MFSVYPSQAAALSTVYPNRFLALCAEVLLGNLTNDFPDKLYSVNTTLRGNILMAGNLTINTGITVTLSQSMVIMAKTVTINGSLTGSGKGTANLFSPFVGIISAGGSGTPTLINNGPSFIGSGVQTGGTNYSFGSGGSVAVRNPFKAFFVKELIKSINADYCTETANGGCNIIIITPSLTLASTGSILANGVGDAMFGGGIGIFGSLITLGAGVISANGVNSVAGIGGPGGTIVILARTSLTDGATKQVNAGIGGAGNGEAGSIISTNWDFLLNI